MDKQNLKVQGYNILTVNIYVCLVLVFAAICLGHIIGYRIRKKEERIAPITILTSKEDIEEVAHVLHDKVVVILNGRNQVVESMHIGVFEPTCTQEKSNRG